MERQRLRRSYQRSGTTETPEQVQATTRQISFAFKAPWITSETATEAATTEFAALETTSEVTTDPTVITSESAAEAALLQ
ncbi:uncharacterized protein LOC119098029 [Pollicipes pollicipes]|uniref:uncharacterized protein LOC119098029 n=1 Tax=Pollicipes pollicipes TaxID=41117 RepID=UPI001884AA75|nr:uncharacterized protein LOC119098029 [Pollicipes pollicipes]